MRENRKTTWAQNSLCSHSLSHTRTHICPLPFDFTRKTTPHPPLLSHQSKFLFFLRKTNKTNSVDSINIAENCNSNQFYTNYYECYLNLIGSQSALSEAYQEINRFKIDNFFLQSTKPISKVDTNLKMKIYTWISFKKKIRCVKVLKSIVKNGINKTNVIECLEAMFESNDHWEVLSSVLRYLLIC